MAQNVYMVSLAFPIPLQKVKMRYRRLHKKEQVLATPFILYPNATCKCWELEDWFCTHPISKNTFYFKSYFNGVDYITREINVKPWLMKLSLGHYCQYLLVLTISIDKVFGTKTEYTINDFCTEFDIINLKKAVFENGENGPFENNNLDGMHLSDWVQLVLKEIEGKERRDAKLSYSIIDICTQRIDVTSAHNEFDKITKLFTSKYYQKSNSVLDYLEQNITLLGDNGITKPSSIPEKNFVYGLLYANDNFMMVNSDTVEKTLGSYYSNNRVEKYWADDECIVHIKTNSPYYCSKKQNDQKLTGELSKELSTLPDMGMLIFMKRRMQKFLSEHRCLSPQQIEDERGALANLFCNKLFNQTEMDKRMDYFIKGFRLRRTFEEIQRIANSTGNSKKLFSLTRTNFWTLFIATITLVATIIGIIVSH